MIKWFKLIVISLALLVLDILSKWYVYINIPKMSWLYPIYPYGGIGVFKHIFGVNFSINYVQNKGAAWGSFSEYSAYLFFFRVLIIIGLICYLIFSNVQFKKAVGFCLIITGAIGNIVDYIFYGYVVDMFYFTFGSYAFPVFNIADSLITIGIIWVLFYSFFSKTNSRVI